MGVYKGLNRNYRYIQDCQTSRFCSRWPCTPEVSTSTRLSSITEFKTISGYWFLTVHTTGKVSVGVTTMPEVLFGPKRIPWSFVPAKYLNTCLTAFQCNQPRFCMNLLMTPTTWAISTRVATIAYIREPTIGAYGTDFIFSPTGADVGQSHWDNRSLMGSGVEADLADCMLKCSKKGPM